MEAVCVISLMELAEGLSTYIGTLVILIY